MTRAGRGSGQRLAGGLRDVGCYMEGCDVHRPQRQLRWHGGAARKTLRPHGLGQARMPGRLGQHLRRAGSDGPGASGPGTCGSLGPSESRPRGEERLDLLERAEPAKGKGGRRARGQAEAVHLQRQWSARRCRPRHVRQPPPRQLWLVMCGSRTGRAARRCQPWRPVGPSVACARPCQGAGGPPRPAPRGAS